MSKDLIYYLSLICILITYTGYMIVYIKIEKTTSSDELRDFGRKFIFVIIVILIISLYYSWR